MNKRKITLNITGEQYEKLNKIVKSQKSEQRSVQRATIILLLASGKNEKGVAKELKISIKTIRKWRDRFANKGMDGLMDSYRSGAPLKFTVVQRCEVIAIACDCPNNYGYDTYNSWTYNALTGAANNNIEGLNMSRSSIVRTLSTNDLKPQKFKMWLHSKDPEFKERVNDVVTLYTDPPEDAVVLCIDEKTGMQATERKNETVMPKPGSAGKYESEYIRHGTQSLITSFDIKTGRVIATCGDSRTAEDLLSFMEMVSKEYENEKKICVVWDNLNIHTNGACERWTRFNKEHDGKFEFHYTPKHASWVNQVEIFFSILQRRCLKHSSFKSKEELKDMVMKFIKIWNDKEGHAFNWTFRGYPMQSREREIA